jgi:2-polyprenyl-6-methoxyphenol hydroxylase-like FAD-dependent oxidoreductase
MNGLRTIGCYQAVKASGIDTTGIEIRNAKGKRLAFAAQSDHEAAFGAPSITIRRGRLAEILLAGARTAGVDLRFNAQVTDVAVWPDGVRLQLDDGTSHDFGILVAADGLASSVRNVVFPEYPKPHFTGLIGTGGITDAPVPDTGGAIRMTFGNNAFFGYLKAKGQPTGRQAYGPQQLPEAHRRPARSSDPRPGSALPDPPRHQDGTGTVAIPGRFDTA